MHRLIRWYTGATDTLQSSSLNGGLHVIRNFLRNFMLGRYGPDHLSIALIILSFMISVVQRIVGFSFLMFLSYAFIFLAIFRLLSRNIPRRRAENDKFIKFWWPVRTRASRFFLRLKNIKTHKFFKCPSCKNILRVPRKKGKLQITCPKCGERFFKKT